MVAETVPAAASPRSETSIDTGNDCPGLTRAGAVARAVVCAGVCTVIVGWEGGAVDTAATLFASEPRACKASVVTPADTAESCQRKLRAAPAGAGGGESGLWWAGLPCAPVLERPAMPGPPIVSEGTTAAARESPL